MPIPRAVIEEIRERVDLEELIGQYVRLKRRGSSTIGLCPFHQEKTPSFHVNGHKNMYYCYGCTEGGDCYSFLQKIEGLSFVEAAHELGKRVGVETTREETREEQTARKHRNTLEDVNVAATQWFHEMLFTHPDAQPVREYLKKRCIEDETIRRSKLGFAPDSYDAMLLHLHKKGFSEAVVLRAALAKKGKSGRSYAAFRNRLIFPIFDEKNRPIAFGGRALSADNPAKYLNSSSYELYDKSRVLYGLNWARNAIHKKKRVLIVEGYFDVLSLHQAGFEEAVASCGTALKSSHLERIKNRISTVYALFDGDEAGLRAAEKSLPTFIGAGLEARFLSLPEGQDPDDFIRTKGGDAFQERLEQSRPLLELVVQRTIERHGTTAIGKKNAINDLLPLLRSVDGLLHSTLIVTLSEMLQIPEQVLREQIGRSNPQRPQRPQQEREQAPATQEPRWHPSSALKDLLWLLVHHPEIAAEVIGPPLPDGSTDPRQLSEHESVNEAIARLCVGESVNDVINETPDTTLRQILSSQTMVVDYMPAEKAPVSARQAVCKLLEKHVKAQLQRLHMEITNVDPSKEPERFTSLVAERIEFQKRRQTLIKTTRTPPTN